MENMKNLGGRPKKVRSDPGLAHAIASARSLGALARIAGVTIGAVSLWVRVPAKAIDVISAEWEIPRHALRPDLYGSDDRPITKL